ncbi:MAG TPA: translation elongation factor Ts [Actinomycetota bacterium]|nr:translation elongation factor Ts [Actinomycetota bacterium]
MAITSGDVKRLRDETGAGMMDCKRALEEAGGDFEQAREILRKKGLADVAKRSGKIAAEGVVEAYIQGSGKRGALVEVNCETDFVANTPEFRTLAREIAMQIIAAEPEWVAREDVPEDVVERERKLFEEQFREQGKPENILPKIVEGKLGDFYEQRCLLDQPFFKDSDGKRTVGDRVAEVSAKVGEKIEVRRFAHFVRGEAGS